MFLDASSIPLSPQKSQKLQVLNYSNPKSFMKQCERLARVSKMVVQSTCFASTVPIDFHNSHRIAIDVVYIDSEKSPYVNLENTFDK